MFHLSFVAVTSRLNFLDECGGDANTRNLVLSQNPHERKSQSLRVKLLSASPSSRYTQTALELHREVCYVNGQQK